MPLVKSLISKMSHLMSKCMCDFVKMFQDSDAKQERLHEDYGDNKE